jgi:predicted GNAT family acetyltransferase
VPATSSVPKDDGDVQPLITDHPERSRFEVTLDGQLAGFADYRRVGGNLEFTHTKVDDRFEGRGIGSALIRYALDAARQQTMGVLPRCPFVRSYIERHGDYLALVPASRRAAFGLD